MRALRAENPERFRAYGREYYAKNRAHIQARSKLERIRNRGTYLKWRKDNRAKNAQRCRDYATKRNRKLGINPRAPKMSAEERSRRRREYWLRHKYGLTPESFTQMLSSQGNKCAVCGRDSRNWVVDHCHLNGKVRGILCDKCNLAIGLLDHSPDNARRAVEYLA
jgi:hypothetical protein